MDEQEMQEKIDKVKCGKSKREVFVKPRPPEEFGDAVELSYDHGLDSFTAIVFDPDMKTVYSEKTLHDDDEVKSFIKATID